MKHLLLSISVLVVLAAGPAAARESVNIRFGDHAGYSRAVFDWTSPVEYTVSEAQGEVSVRFERAADFDISQFRARAPRAIGAVKVSADGRTVRFEAPSGDILKAFRIGPKVVVDVALGAATARPARPARKTDYATQPLADALGRAREAAEMRTPSPKPAPASAPEPKKPAARAEAPAPAKAAAEPAPRPVSDPSQTVRVEHELRPGRTIFRFRWPVRTSAAALHRGEHVWLVFGDDMTPDFGGQPTTGLGPVDRIEPEHSSDGTLFRIDVAAGSPLDITVDGNDWVVDIGGGRGRAESAVIFDAQAESARGPRMFAAVADAARPVIVDDPLVGDRIALIPLREAALGVRPERRLVKFDLPETPQGVAVRFKSLDLDVAVDESGLSIAGPRTLHLAAEATTAAHLTEGPPKLNGDGAPTPSRRVLDLTTWKGEEDPVAIRQDLLQRISVAQPLARNGERRILARFMVANGLASEALGVMARIEDDDKRADIDPGYRALRGVARLLAGQYAEAAADLRHPQLKDAGDVALFRGLLAAKRREFQEARREFRYGLTALDELPADMQPMFRIALAETALHLHDPALAEEQVAKLLKQAGTEARREEARLLAARIKALTGETEDAADLFAELSESVQRSVRARARFAETDLLLDDERITRKDAIERLERLRFAWRGDVFEFDLMRRLGELYIDVGDYRLGMVTMRRTVEQFPDLPEAQKLAGGMNEVFASLFEGVHAESMSPVTAMGLYYDFRELTPEGDRGDRMIRRLADRLAAVELLDEAAKLLEHQVRHRLTGVEKSRVATRLAVLYLLDRKPNEAISALRASRNLSLTDDQVKERRMLEARGLTDLGHYERALALLNGLEGEDVNDVRTEILWRARKWQRAAVSLSTRLVELRTTNKELDTEARQDILRFAIASSLAGDRPALERIRDDFTIRMQDKPEWPAFQVVTSVDQRETAEFRNLAAEIAQVGRFEQFMTAYREKLRDTPLSAIN
ncbi:tetratricopeptide repeat protein [Minwuia thermotolerans]|uniref:Tetratricopeptide repeat protein n=1 Tax=Minwuia thermotolerans TaxID=2056226 RepID=A0A2M9FXR9_9PROT|nr:hypothetical protein [Minwuia thermotolerans]PJK28244.1 hypothetical protein CVT23_17890 [Minwuia thermotolerans]